MSRKAGRGEALNEVFCVVTNQHPAIALHNRKVQSRMCAGTGMAQTNRSMQAWKARTQFTPVVYLAGKEGRPSCG